MGKNVDIVYKTGGISAQADFSIDTGYVL